MRIFKGQHGFTLVEMIVIIGLIGIIFGGLIMLIDPAKQLAKGRDGQRKADLRSIQTALELYRADNGSYPLHTNSGGKTGGWAGAGGMVEDLNDDDITYMRNIPEDPNAGSCGYVYLVPGDGSEYNILTTLENSDDPDAIEAKPEPADYCSPCDNHNNITIDIGNGSCQATGYNYWVTSP